MKRTDIVPVDAPRDFRPSELFFSITDPKGVIVSGNQVFVRVSGWDPDELIGSAHNIIRHPDMPRAAFKLLWDHLLAGEKVAAYVKNMAKDGKYYWVVAFVAPIEGGFLSIRYLPTSALRGEVEKVYGVLREIELAAEARGDWKAGMAQAGEKLGEILGSLGFASYDDFMRHLVHTELAARRDALRGSHEQILPDLPPATRAESSAARDLRGFHKEGQELFRRASDFEAALQASVRSIDTLDERAKTILELGTEFHYVATNITVKAARLGLDGKVLGVIAGRLAEAAGQVTRIVKQLRGQVTSANERLRHVLFDMEWAGLQLEMVVAFYAELWQDVMHGEGTHGEHWQRNCRDLLRRQAAFDQTSRETVAGLQGFGSSLHELARDAENLHKAMLTIEMTHVSGLIETKRLRRDDGCSVIFAAVREQIDGIKGDLEAFRAALKELTAIARQTPEMALAYGDAVDLFSRAGEHVAAMQDTATGWSPVPARHSDPALAALSL